MIIRTVREMQASADEFRRNGKSIGLVPTMGYLHQGHTSLMQVAKTHAEIVVTSIYVNPTQFGPNEDLESYPRDLEHDEKVAYANGTDILFIPDDAEMYQDPLTTVHVKEITAGLCGASRPWHFDGVTTIVTKLFNIVKPHVAVFGQKDGQQARVVRKMVQDLSMDVEIVVAPIIREPDGLAMSSRNKYLTADERRQALVLNQALQSAVRLVDNRERDATTITGTMRKIIQTAPAAKIDYIEIVDEKLQPVSKLQGNIMIALAVFIGKTRLIDNVELDVS